MIQEKVFIYKEKNKILELELELDLNKLRSFRRLKYICFSFIEYVTYLAKHSFGTKKE